MRAIKYDQAFRERARRKQAWGLALIAGASLVWIWLAYQLLFPFSVDLPAGKEQECQSRVFFYSGDEGSRMTPDDYLGAEGKRCDAARDLGGLLAALVLSLPLAVGGTVLSTSAGTADRLSRHAAEVARLTAHPEG
ncbi:hypothetical protein [Streptomyces sp. NBC_01264]|uniref:hypothetical protein n=1 Tax=Streptomyces sp. NBC_01264 TaxID=2903804 RepID=UPI00225C077A|nr:hypothetical protein [Streptomyces sp. NBC_01264]MCX4776416.1 hypothetical protein [Streptomyces sp. NBC_01264]